MDAFIDDDWITPQVARKHIDSGKKVCIVSPEIHNRPYKKLWSKFRESTNDYNNQITLCTDFPEIAAEFFKNEKD